METLATLCMALYLTSFTGLAPAHRLQRAPERKLVARGFRDVRQAFHAAYDAIAGLLGTGALGKCTVSTPSRPRVQQREQPHDRCGVLRQLALALSPSAAPLCAAHVNYKGCPSLLGEGCPPLCNHLRKGRNVMLEIMLGTGMWALWILAMTTALILPFWFIFPKAGYSKWLTLLMTVPLVNVFLLYFLAFSKWPNLGNSNPYAHLPREH